MKTAKETLDESTWSGKSYEFEHNCNVISTYYAGRLMEEYANEKVKEAVKIALQTAAEKATCSDASWSALPKYTVDVNSIIDLEQEVLEKLNPLIIKAEKI